MLREIEELYIDTYSIWEKHRKRICWSALGGTVICAIILHFSLLWGNIILGLEMIILIVAGLYGRRKDYYNQRRKYKKGTRKFKYLDYKMLKMNELKNKVESKLKEKAMYNKESLDIIINKFEKKINKYDRISVISLTATIIIALLGFDAQRLAVAVLLLIFLGLLMIIPKILEFALDCILVNKVKYEELIEVLTEIQLELINNNISNKRKRQKNSKTSDLV